MTPLWAQKIRDLYDARVSHAFVVHFNVHDYLLIEEDRKQRVREWLLDDFLKDFQTVIYFDLATGIRSRTKDELNRILDNRLPPTNAPLDEWLNVIDEWLGKADHRAAVIIGFAETIFGDQQQPQLDQQARLIRLLHWARDSSKNDDLIILLTNNQAQLAQKIRLSASEFEFVKVPLPDEKWREQYINCFPQIPGCDPLTDLVAHSSGLTLAELDSICLEATQAEKPITADAIWRRKTQLLAQSTAGLLQIKRATWTEECLGGLQEAKAAILPLVQAVKTGDVLSVPMGLLFMGPPGTGKSLLAEILSGKLTYPMVEFGQIRNMYVGNSEANMSLVLEYIESLAPVVVFEDEFDQAEVQRTEVQGLDAGVSEHLRAMKMEFMARSDLRGKVIWIGATNRPDLVDPAFMRPGRFDLRVPFLPPISTEDRVPIYQAIFNKMSQMDQNFVYEITPEELRQIAERSTYQGNGVLPQLEEGVLQAAVKSFTGAEIELICHRAWQLSAGQPAGQPLRSQALNGALDDFIPDRPRRYVEMIQMALAYTNFRSFLPAGYRPLFEARR